MSIGDFNERGIMARGLLDTPNLQFLFFSDAQSIVDKQPSNFWPKISSKLTQLLLESQEATDLNFFDVMESIL